MTDLAEDYFISKWPNWLRWIIFIPAAFVIALILKILVDIGATSQGFSEDSWYKQVVESGLFGMVFVIVGAHIAPRRQKQAAIALLVIAVLYSLTGTLFVYAVEQSVGLLNLLVGGALVVGSVGGYVYVSKRLD